MNNYIESVKKFHEVFNVPVNDYKNDIDLKTRQLRIKLIFEELQELAEACDVKATFANLCKSVFKESFTEYNQEFLTTDDDNIIKFNDGNNVNKKEELDALCDLQYVLSGSVLSLGYQDKFDKAFDEVQASNMSKICSNMEEVEKTMSDYKAKGMESYYVQKEEGYLVFRQEDDKVLKNSFYKEANLHQFI